MTLMYLWKIIPIMKSTNIYLKKRSIVTLESILFHSAISFVVTQEEWALDVRWLPNTDFSFFFFFFQAFITIYSEIIFALKQAFDCVCCSLLNLCVPARQQRSPLISLNEKTQHRHVHLKAYINAMNYDK